MSRVPPIECFFPLSSNSVNLRLTSRISQSIPVFLCDMHVCPDLTCLTATTDSTLPLSPSVYPSMINIHSEDDILQLKSRLVSALRWTNSVGKPSLPKYLEHNLTFLHCSFLLVIAHRLHPYQYICNKVNPGRYSTAACLIYWSWSLQLHTVISVSDQQTSTTLCFFNRTRAGFTIKDKGVGELLNIAATEKLQS